MVHAKRQATLYNGQRNPTKRKLRPCPKCGAAPNQSCRRLSGVPGTSGQYYVRLKEFHVER